MPYIKPDDKERFSQALEQLAASPPTTPGELNYLVSQLSILFWFNSGQNYQAINDILGSLEGAKLEFYRRLASPYENKKIAENGDVYPTVR